MKFTQLLFFLFLALVAYVAAAQEDDVQAAQQKGEEGEHDVEAEVVCEEICASQVAEATRVVNQEMAALEDQLSPLRSALEQAQQASVVAASEVITLKGQLASMESVVAAAKLEAEEVKTEAEAAIAVKVQEMEAVLAATKARLVEFESARYFINRDKIKADFTALLKKYGLVKDEVVKVEL